MMRTKRIGLAMLSASAFFGLDPAAHAQERAAEREIPPDVRARGQRLQDEALAHVEAQRWALAADTYRQVYELGREYGVARAPVALWDMGLALMQVAGREADAHDAFQRFLDESTTLTEDAEVRDWRSNALEHIAELNARIGTTTEASTSAQGTSPTAPGNGEDTSSAGPHATTMSPVGPVLLGVGVATLGVGAVFGILALLRENDLASRCGGTACLDTPEHHMIYDEMRLLGGVTDVLLVAGGIITAGAVILTLTLTEGTGETATRAQAVLSPGGGRFVLAGRF